MTCVPPHVTLSARARTCQSRAMVSPLFSGHFSRILQQSVLHLPTATRVQACVFRLGIGACVFICAPYAACAAN